jgi:hypothetical protein
VLYRRCKPVYSVTLMCCVMAGCAGANKLPKIWQVPEDYYPPASKRLGEEGRVLVEFHLDEHRRPFQLTIRQTDLISQSNNGASRLNEGALRVIESLGLHFSDRTKPNPKLGYRVTVIFCLQPGNCDRISPFRHTQTMVVNGKPVHDQGGPPLF